MYHRIILVAIKSNQVWELKFAALKKQKEIM
jgi:hypothetical protein